MQAFSTPDAAERCPDCRAAVPGGPQRYAAIQHSLNGPSDLKRPPGLLLTVADSGAAQTPADFRRLVAAWVKDVWQAYAPQHALARQWLSGLGVMAGRRS